MKDMIITLDKYNNYVGIMFDDPEVEKEDHPGVHWGGWLKTHFLEYYDIEDEAGEVESVFFEPKNDLYVIVFNGGKGVTYKHYDDHPVLAAFAKFANQLKDDELIIKHNLYPGLTDLNEPTNWKKCLRDLSNQLGLEKKNHIKHFNDIPIGAFKTGTTTKTILDSYGVGKTVAQAITI